VECSFKTATVLFSFTGNKVALKNTGMWRICMQIPTVGINITQHSLVYRIPLESRSQDLWECDFLCESSWYVSKLHSYMVGNPYI